MTEINTNSIVVSFFRWYFWLVPTRSILRIGGNYILWAWHFFSIGFFPTRLFAPWHKDITSYGRGFDLMHWLHVFGWNIISRVLGAIMRLIVLVFGLMVELVFCVLIATIFVAWFLLPVLVVINLFYGFLMLV